MPAGYRLAAFHTNDEHLAQPSTVELGLGLYLRPLPGVSTGSRTLATPRKLTIVCFSSQPREDGMWTNKHHIMSRVAKQHRVLFVNFRQQSPFKFVRSARR